GSRLPEGALDLSDQWRERQVATGYATGQLVRQLFLPFREERLHDPRARARIAPPIGIVALAQALGDERLKLPGAQIAGRVVAGIDIDEGFGAIVLEAGGLGEQIDVQVGEPFPSHVAAVEMRLVDELRGVTPDEMQLLE